MSFVVPADSYDPFMGRYSLLLAPLFADFAGVSPPMAVLEVGCGPGALTTELVRRLGAPGVTGVDPGLAAPWPPVSGTWRGGQRRSPRCGAP